MFSSMYICCNSERSRKTSEWVEGYCTQILEDNLWTIYMVAQVVVLRPWWKHRGHSHQELFIQSREVKQIQMRMYAIMVKSACNCVATPLFHPPLQSLIRDLGGVWLTQQNPDPVRDTNLDANFSTLSKRKYHILPCSGLWTKHYCIQNNTNDTSVLHFMHLNEGTQNQPKLCG